LQQQVGQGLTTETAQGIDIIAFVHGVWIPNHRKKFWTTVGKSEEKVASASAIEGVISHLAKMYLMMERQDSANPAKEESVLSYKKGYRDDLHDRGVCKKRAKIMKEGKVNDLINYLSRQIKAAEKLERIVLLMDRAAVLYLWESWARGKECGELESRQIDWEDGVALPGWSKTMRAEPSGRIDLTNGGKKLTILKGSAEMLAEMGNQGILADSRFLFCLLNKSRTGLKDEPLKSNALRKRIQKHLTNANLFEGEALHSFRRSAVQHAAELEGFDVEKLMKRGRWSSQAAFKLYIEEIRHKFGRQKKF
jgi:integrase